MTKIGLATVYGAGLSPWAPGTVGSLVGAFLAYPILLLPHEILWLSIGVVLSTILGTRSATRYMRVHAAGHDPSEIVIDEVAGQWLTYLIGYGWFFGIAGNMQSATPLLTNVGTSPLYLALGFLLFRLFDILKPWPISLADRTVKGGFGVMFDDLLAAIPAGTFLTFCYLFIPMLNRQLETM